MARNVGGRTRADAPIAILTDFGYRDHYVGAIKGVIASIAPGASIIDITHGIPAQSITAGALTLAQSWRYFPRETIFLVVVDPGVGTARRAIAVGTRAGARFVGPDNGVLAIALQEAGPGRAVELRDPRYRLAQVSATFHGRDIFAPAAAHLRRGVKLEALGPVIRGLMPLDLPEAREGVDELRGEVLYVDGYGNLLSNISRDALIRFESRFPAMRLSVRIGTSAPIGMYQAYGDAPRGAPLATFGSFELMEIAVRDGSAEKRFAARPGAIVTVRPAGRNTATAGSARHPRRG
jgi:S-adenosylmethionine hydrolase